MTNFNCENLWKKLLEKYKNNKLFQTTEINFPHNDFEKMLEKNYINIDSNNLKLSDVFRYQLLGLSWVAVLHEAFFDAFIQMISVLWIRKGVTMDLMALWQLPIEKIRILADTINESQNSKGFRYMNTNFFDEERNIIIKNLKLSWAKFS